MSSDKPRKENNNLTNIKLQMRLDIKIHLVRVHVGGGFGIHGFGTGIHHCPVSGI